MKQAMNADSLALISVIGGDMTILQSIAAGVTIIDKTHAEMLPLVSASELTPGQLYRITDLRTRHLIPNTAEYNIGPTEPMIVTATTVNTLFAEAYSETYPQDIIYYELVDSSTAGGDRGRIYFRHNTVKNISVWEDWRAIKYRRWETTLGSGVFKLFSNLPVWIDEPVTSFLSGNRIVIPIDTQLPLIGQQIEIYSSTSNDGYFTVSNILIGAGEATLTVNENIVEEAAGGAYCYYPYTILLAYVDRYIFNNSSTADTCNNITIERHTLEPLVNITFGLSCYDITLGKDTSHSIFGNYNYKIIWGGSCNYNILSDAASYILFDLEVRNIKSTASIINISIGSFSSFITFDNTGNSFISIGENVEYISFDGNSTRISIGDNTRGTEISPVVIQGQSYKKYLPIGWSEIFV